MVGQSLVKVSEGLLCIFPVIKLMSSPSKSVKGPASELLLSLENHLVKLLDTPQKEFTKSETGFPSISCPEIIVFRLLQYVWHQVLYLVNIALIHQLPWLPRIVTKELQLYAQRVVNLTSSKVPNST